MYALLWLWCERELCLSPVSSRTRCTRELGDADASRSVARVERRQESAGGSSRQKANSASPVGEVSKGPEKRNHYLVMRQVRASAWAIIAFQLAATAGICVLIYVSVHANARSDAKDAFGKQVRGRGCPWRGPRRHAAVAPAAPSALGGVALRTHPVRFMPFHVWGISGCGEKSGLR
jgi:hypothetical protein